MKRKIAWILASVLLLLVFGAAFSIDVAQIKGKDSKDPENTTPPSTTVPDVEEPPREIETYLDNLLKSYLPANRIYPDVVYIADDVDAFVSSMNSTLVDPDRCLSSADEGLYLNLSNFNDSQAYSVFETRSVPYGSDVIVSFSVGNPYFEETITGGFKFAIRTGHSATSHDLILLTASDGKIYGRTALGTRLLFELSDTLHKISLHLSLTGGFVDFYLDGVFLYSLELSDFNVDLSSDSVTSGFWFGSILPNTVGYYFDSFTIFVPRSVYGDAMPISPEVLDDLLADGFEKDFTFDFTAGHVDDARVTTDSSGNFQTRYTSNGLLIEAAKSDFKGISASVREYQSKSYPDFFVVDYVLSLADPSPNIVLSVGSVELLYIAPDGRLKLLTSHYSPASSNQIGKDVEYDKADDGSLRLSLNVNLETNLVDLYVNGTLAYSNFYCYFYTVSNRNVVDFQVYSHQEDLMRSVTLESVSVFSKALN